METLFELKTAEQFDISVFERMKKSAENVSVNIDTVKRAQVIVLLTANEVEYSAVISDPLTEGKTEESAFLEKITAENNTKISYALCMWKDSCIDVPSFAFRKMMVELDPENNNTMIFVQTAKGISAVKLSNIMK